MTDELDELRLLVKDSEDYLTRSYNDLWSKVPTDSSNLEAYSVIGALLSRQVTLAIQLARSPSSWNGHSAPLYLRAQTDLHITLSWILEDLTDRARKYVLHGLGEEKLIVEHYKQQIQDDPDSPIREAMEKLIATKSAWIDSQRHEWMVEVNFGTWSEINTRTMAKEANCETLYNFAYKPFSQAVHSTWPHISVYNSKNCQNPLHRYHLIPELFDAPMDVDFLYRSFKYVHKSYESIINKFSLTLNEPKPLQWWNSYFSDNQQ